MSSPHCRRHLTGLCRLMLSFLLCSQIATAAQDEAEATGSSGWRKQFASFVKDKKDREVVDQVGKLKAAFADLKEADQKASVTAVAKVLNARRDEEDNRIHLVALEAMGEMGKNGAKHLRRALKNKQVESRPEVLGVTLIALARHQSKTDLKALFNYLFHKDNKVVAAAAESLAAFQPQPGKLRKQIVEEMINNYSSIYANSLPTPPGQRQAGKPVKPPDRRRLDAVKDSFEATLRVLTDGNVKTATKWRLWYNDNRRRSWDKKER